MGFAIPINMVRIVTDQIIEAGDIRRGSLGITFDNPTPDVIRELKITARLNGAVIVKVDPRSAGARAGLKSGDVVTEIGDRPVPELGVSAQPVGAPEGRRRGRIGGAARRQAALKFKRRWRNATSAPARNERCLSVHAERAEGCGRADGGVVHRDLASDPTGLKRSTGRI